MAHQDIIIQGNDFDVKAVAEEIACFREHGQKHAIIVLAEGVMHAIEFSEKLSEYGDSTYVPTVLGHVVRSGFTNN